ncbi:MAG: type II toxin-antitoxin system death-on-curing family toxin [Balneola sp.]|nr:type II toxin-antitoxin system death-on-curing family toxin [Balneola sp.]MBO6649716.1 type II toxin-antitoxin system death-on-curing family toxin [Balneola sp.]MBO6712278.1 type II toxin-antitoxin system death-on-curing family toxin [Balneola sp.]MBO6800472.1 type II toxin-antitoxin system death-on-curing family toxin [Balneola sp.]MBO6871426.1 type II toxin-antitoxin system death-on-curing family toxin [Balneola sp.]
MIKFLDKKTILEFHENQIKLYGGASGIRSEELLESALSQPQVSFGGDYICKDIFEMAATYGFHICQNHPFFDGNKRTALIAIYTFLFVNGYRLNANKKGLYAIIIALSKGELDKKELTFYLESNSQKIS